jgi:hypothetical protein
MGEAGFSVLEWEFTGKQGKQGRMTNVLIYQGGDISTNKCFP